jgi:hypothetical protein
VATTRQYPVRAAVVESLGFMFADEPNKELVTFLVGRLSDENVSHAESSQVRAAAAIALARMNVTDQAPVIERFFTPKSSYNELTAASNWALVRLADHPPYQPAPIRARKFGWFLEPIDE